MSYPAEQAPAEVLLVEDDLGDALIIQEAFGKHAIRNVLHVVTDGEQALQFLRHQGRFGDAPRPGLMLLDLNLPRRNGLEVLAEVRADAEIASIPIVMLTTSGAPRTSCAATSCMPALTSPSPPTTTNSSPRSAASTASTSASPASRPGPQTESLLETHSY